MSNLRMWLVSPVMRKATELTKTAIMMNNAATVLKNMQALCPGACFTICTNECDTRWNDLGVAFNNGNFIDL